MNGLFHSSIIITQPELKVTIYETLHDYILMDDISTPTNLSPMKLISSDQIGYYKLSSYSHILYIGTDFKFPSILFSEKQWLHIFILSNFDFKKITNHFMRYWIIIYNGIEKDKIITEQNFNNFLYLDIDYKNIFNFYYESSKVAIDHLSYLSNKSGFELCRIDGEKSNKIRFYCNRKSQKGHCQFSIYLKKIKELFEISNANLIHNHDVFPQATFHRNATSSQVELIKSFKESNIKNSVIAKIMGQLYGNQWEYITTRQIREIYKKDYQKNLSEIHELEELITNNSGIYRIFDCNEIPLAVFTATDQEIINGKEYGDVIVIDGTHYPNRNDYEVVPITAFDKNLKIKSVGTLFTKSSIREVYLFLIQCLSEFCILITIISDEESGIVSVLRNEFNMLNHIICAWHKQKNILKQINKYFRNAQNKNEMIKAVKIICYSYNKKKVDESISFLSGLESDGFQEYLQEHVIVILKNFSPAYIDFFCLGKNVSSAGESANSLIKSNISARYYRLAQIKGEIIRLYNRKEIGEIDRTIYRRYNKTISEFEYLFHITLPSRIIDIMEYSMEKMRRLEMSVVSNRIIIVDKKKKNHI